MIYQQGIGMCPGDCPPASQGSRHSDMQGPTHWHWPVHSAMTECIQTESNSLLFLMSLPHAIIMVANKGIEHKVTPK